MEERAAFPRWARSLALGAAAAALLWRFRREAALAARLLLGAATVAFLLDPIATRLEARMSRPRAAACAFLAGIGLMAGALLLLVPPVAAQFGELVSAMPETVAQLNVLIGRLNAFLEAHGARRLSLSALDWPSLSAHLGGLWAGTARLFGSVAGAVTEGALSLALGYSLLADKPGALLRAEMLLPQRWRLSGARAAAAAVGELRGYIRGQALVALCVGALSALGLALARVPGFLALGLIVGICNCIPYFGPLIGGVPAVLCALPGGLWRAVLTAAVLATVQQIDGMLLTPRITGGATGLSAPTVMLSVLLGGSAFGTAGMLLAVPAVCVLRSVGRALVGAREAPPRAD